MASRKIEVGNGWDISGDAIGHNIRWVLWHEGVLRAVVYTVTTRRKIRDLSGLKNHKYVTKTTAIIAVRLSHNDTWTLPYICHAGAKSVIRQIVTDIETERLYTLVKIEANDYFRDTVAERKRFNAEYGTSLKPMTIQDSALNLVRFCRKETKGVAA